LKLNNTVCGEQLLIAYPFTLEFLIQCFNEQKDFSQMSGALPRLFYELGAYNVSLIHPFFGNP